VEHLSGEELLEILMDHARLNEYRSLPEPATHRDSGTNPFCGDEVTLSLFVDDGIVVEAGFEGQGCLMSQGTASLLCENVKGKSVTELRDSTFATLLGFDHREFTTHKQHCCELSYKILRQLVSGT